ncbi:unnamed protein product [Adineta steineri]|uniref:phosphoinositide 5-phosphatase n=2 Tax=Adineta steineri TaxID=433720 RepID=A0A814I5J1_9BILA|nr:unnamed protein product [Adineta steineri]CAF3776031.1 unnamed protein product [Adineta steineri]
MFPNAAPTEPNRTSLPPAAPVSNWSVALYRKAEPILPLNPVDVSQTPAPQQTYGSFYIQLQQQASSTSPSRSDVLYFRYQAQQQRNSADSYTLPFTISQLSDMKLAADTAPISSTSGRSPSNVDQQAGLNDSSDIPPTLLLRAKAFLGVLVLNSSGNSITANTAGIIRPFLLFSTEEVFIGQLFDAYIFRISQVATISMRDNPEDEVYVSGIKKLFQGRCFYYATYMKPELNTNKPYFNKPYDITLCAQRMIQGHDSDIRFYWNRGLCLPLLKYNIDIRYWIPKVLCGGIETHRNANEDVELWLISRLSCERAGTRFNVRGVNDDGAVANFVETEQIVFLPRQNNYSSFIIVRGSIPLFWHQPRFQVGAHRITISRSEALSFKSFFEHFKHLYRHYGRVLIINLVDQRDDEKRVGDEYRQLFNLLVKTYQSKQKKEKKILNYLNENDFIWFDYHEQARQLKGFTPERFVDKVLIQNSQYSIGQELEQQNIFTYMDGKMISHQKGVFRINCIDCLDRTNNVQLTLGMVVLTMQLASLKKQVDHNNLVERIKDMWINNGDNISRIYTGTGAIGQRSKAKDIQRSLGRAIQNSLRDDEKQQSMQTLIYSYAKDSYLHERSVAALLTPYVISDGIILSEMYRIRQQFIKKEKIRISIGTWNINGDKNPALEDAYPSILNSWILDGPESMSAKDRKDMPDAIPTMGFVADGYTKKMPDILAIGFQEICDLTASNMVWQSSVNATRWVDNVEAHFKKSYPNDEYILLGNDQLVGVCLAIFIRRDLAPFVKNIVVDSVKTGMGGKIGNKGCVAIRLVLYNTSICFICAHFTAGQNEFNERNKDYKSIMEKLSFQPPSRALWHDHIFFLGDFNYRLTIPRTQVEQFVKANAYKQLLEYDQLKKEHTEGRVFREFLEGPVNFPPTYKYDVNSDEYDTSEKARTPSYTDRILWRSINPDICTKQLYYGRAEVKTSDHRPVSSIFDVEVEKCDEIKMHQEYINIYKRFQPSHAQMIIHIKTETNLRKNQLIEEFDMYFKKNYGLDIVVVDRYFTTHHKHLLLNVFFENGEQARKVSEPKNDQLPNGLNFSKRLVNMNEDFALGQKINLLFADANETMFPESTAYDLGSYQQPSPDALSTVQDVTVAGVARTISDMMKIIAMENLTSPSTTHKKYGRISMHNFDPSKLTGIADAANVSITTSDIDDNHQQREDDIEQLQEIKEAQRVFEQRRRTYGDIFNHDFDSDSDENNDDLKQKSSKSSSDSDSDAPTSTDTDSPYGSDSESSSSYDEYHAIRQIPKKKIHRHHKGPLKSYFEERIGNWPKYRYKKYKRRHMKKHGIEINYGNIHTKEIKRSLKDEKHQRKNYESQLINVSNMMEPVVKKMSFVSLDPEHPITPADLEKVSVLSTKSVESEDNHQTKSPSTYKKMKQKFKKTFKRKHKVSASQKTDDEEQLATNSDAASCASAGDDILADEKSADDTIGNQRQYSVCELISFASLDIPDETNLQTQTQTTDSLFNDDCFDPFNLYNKSTSINSDINDNSFSFFEQQPPAATASMFPVDPFGMSIQPVRDTKSPLNMFSSTLTNTNNNFFVQSQSQLIPNRIVTPSPTNISIPSKPVTVKNLSINPPNKKNETVTDLLDFGEPNPPAPPPPESPKFDPYG